LVALLFLDDVGETAGVSRLETLLPDACPVEDTEAVASLVRPVSDWLNGGAWPTDLPIDLRGTEFQRAVWEALRAIPEGETRSYGAIARAIGRPRSSRAVGAACGANPIAILVPCHRALGSDGSLVNYRWGIERKRMLLERERARSGLALSAS
jgi:O-6-methylguanine DNA methyltransferase